MPNYTLPRAERAVLKMIVNQNDRELYGLEMVRLSGNEINIKAIYTTLKRMEKKGYITSRKERRRHGNRGLPRRFYKVTRLGRIVLSSWGIADSAANTHR